MKLLTKSEINKNKAMERQILVEEGLKVAKRVDSLRETHAQEESALEKFRRETLEKIMTEIDEANNEKATILKETAELEERNKQSLISIQQTKEELARGLSDVENMKTDNLSLGELLRQKEYNIEQSNQSITKRDGQSQSMHIEANALLEEASIINEDMVREQGLLRDTLSTAQAKLSQLEKDRESFEVSCKAKEQSFKERELEIVEAKKDLGRREKALRDQLAMFQRNLKRFNK